MESDLSPTPMPAGAAVMTNNVHPAYIATVEDQGSGGGSGTSSEDEGVGGESEESEGSGPESTDGEHQNGEENEWSDESESSVASSEGAVGAAQILFPAVLPATSVKFIAQTVGYNLPSAAAAALGHLALNSLRRVTMIANQLRKHEQSQGLGADHFAMAEKLMGTQSFGYGSKYSSPDFTHVGKGISVLHDSPQIDLLGTMLDARKNPKPLRKRSRMSLSHHQLPSPTMPFGEESTNEGPEPSDSSSSSYFVSDNEVQRTPAPQSHDATITKVKKLRKRSEIIARRGRLPAHSPSNLPFTKITSSLEKLIEKVLVLNEEFIPEKDSNGSDGEIRNEIDVDKTGEVPDVVSVGIEWVDYMKVFIISFFHRTLESADESTEGAEIVRSGNSENREGADGSNMLRVSPRLLENGEAESKAWEVGSRKLDEASSTDFKDIIEDITSNGAFPVLGIILNFFNDYIQRRFGNYDREGFQRILNIIEATLKCPARTDTAYFHKICQTLIKLTSIPPPCELHQNIAQVFILLIKKGSKEFSVGVTLWTCEFVTETLSSCLTSCLHAYELNLILINLALSLAIALEEIGIHLIVVLDWHTLVLEFVQALHYLRSQPTDSRGRNLIPGAEPMDTDELPQAQAPAEAEAEQVTKILPETKDDPLEESLMVFFRLLLKNYTPSLPAVLIRRIHTLFLDTFGEKVVPYVTLALPDSLPPLKNQKLENHVSPSKRIRSIPWKTKRISIGKIPTR